MTEEEKQSEYLDADWLHDASWRWVRWHAPHPGWDHDHCVFCDAHICDKPEHVGVLRECWHWDDPEEAGNYESVCAACFRDLRDTFRWSIVPGSPLPGEPSASHALPPAPTAAVSGV